MGALALSRDFRGNVAEPLVCITALAPGVGV